MRLRDITTIQVDKETKKRFSKQYAAAKKKTKERHFYMNDYLNALLDLEANQ